MRFRSELVLAAALAIALLLASCGNGDEPDGATETPGIPGPGDQVTPAIPPPGDEDGTSPDDEQGVSATPQPGGDLFSISVDGIPGCDTSEGDAECSLDLGETFDVNFHLNSLPAGLSEYEGWDGVLLYSGVTSTKSADGDLWPDCEFAVSYFDTPGLAAVGCALGLENISSTYTGILASTGFTCPDEPVTGSVALLHGLGNTVIWENVASSWADEEGTGETLTIICGAP